MSSIAFLGLGAMGSRMAARLIDAGHAVRLWNRSAAAAESLIAKGATLLPSPRAAAAGAEFVFSMVTDDAASRRVWLDPEDGALAGLAEGAIAVECSTISPDWVRELGDAVLRRGGQFLDAPVAGSRPQAENGQLVFMLGGAPETVEAIRPLLAPLAAKCLPAGGIGQGAMLKLAVNALFAAQLESVAELLGLLGRNGFDRQKAAELLGEFPVVAPPLAGAARMMAANSLAPLFTIDLIEKDLRYVLAAAQSSGAELPGTARTHEVFARARGAGLGQRNISGIASLFA